MVYEVDSVLFNCKASGVPIPNISWYFIGAPFKEPNKVYDNIIIIKPNYRKQYTSNNESWAVWYWYLYMWSF